MRDPATPARSVSRARGSRGWLVAAAALALWPAPAAAEELEDLNQLALAFTRGEFVAPLTCELEGKARRGLRRMLVTPGPRHVRPPVNKLRFVELVVPEGSRCFTDTGEPQMNVTGALLYRLNAHSRPDIANYDFKDKLRREGGFTFDVHAGALRVDGADVDFREGTARFDLVRPGSDADKRLADVPGPRKFHLTLESTGGTKLVFDLVLAAPR